MEKRFFKKQILLRKSLKDAYFVLIRLFVLFHIYKELLFIFNN